MSAPPSISDISLFRYCESIIDFDAEVPDGALDFRVTEQKLHRPQVAGAPIDRIALVRRRECVPNRRGSKPILATHSETSRAYCPVIIPWPAPRRPGNRNSPDLRLAARR